MYATGASGTPAGCGKIELMSGPLSGACPDVLDDELRLLQPTKRRYRTAERQPDPTLQFVPAAEASIDEGEDVKFENGQLHLSGFL